MDTLTTASGEHQLHRASSSGAFKIRLGDFGYIRLSLFRQRRCGESGLDVSENSIKKDRIIFTPGEYIKNVLQTIKVSLREIG